MIESKPPREPSKAFATARFAVGQNDVVREVSDFAGQFLAQHTGFTPPARNRKTSLRNPIPPLPQAHPSALPRKPLIPRAS
jgi:hypothetical protein